MRRLCCLASACPSILVLRTSSESRLHRYLIPTTRNEPAQKLQAHLRESGINLRVDRLWLEVVHMAVRLQSVT